MGSFMHPPKFLQRGPGPHGAPYLGLGWGVALVFVRSVRRFVSSVLLSERGVDSRSGFSVRGLSLSFFCIIRWLVFQIASRVCTAVPSPFVPAGGRACDFVHAAFAS